MGVFDDLANFSGGIGSSGKSKFNDLKEKSSLKPSDKLILDIEALGFNMSQLKSILLTKGNQLIISCAGSGKTTSIIFKIIYDLKSGRSTIIKSINGNNVRVPNTIWVATFLRSGADELRSSYRKWCNKLHCSDMSQVMQFSTLHAEFKRALNSLGLVTDIISDVDNKKLLKKVLNTYSIKNSRGVFPTEEEITTLIGALTRSRNRLDSEKYISDIYDELNIFGSILDCILRDWKNERLAINKVDFEDLQEILYDFCYVKKNVDVISFLANRFAYIYIDEFQDTSQIQYALLKVYCSNVEQIVAIGDDDQTIYSWRGSDNNIITELFIKDFNPIKNDLSVNFRCPSNILNAIKPSICNNKTRFDKQLTSSVEGGILRVGDYQGYSYMVSALCDLVYNDIKNGYSVAVLCRTNADGLLPALFFDKFNRFSFSISSSGMSLDSYIGRLVISIIKLLTDSYSYDVQRALSLLTWNNYGVKSLMSVCKNNNESIWTISSQDLIYSCPEISEQLITWRELRKEMEDIATLKYILQDYRFNVFVKDNQFNDIIKSVLISIESLLEFYNYTSVEDFLLEINDINVRLKAREKKLHAQVRISTVHEYKGKEADSIYVWNDSKDVFPHKRSVGSVNDYEEERRVHYIACTRARKISTLMYLRNKAGDFLNEMDLSNAEKMKKETSGVLKKTIMKESEENIGLSMFIDKADENSKVFDIDDMIS